MPSILLTAFEPYDAWSTNASWLTLVELTKELPSHIRLVTRLYPVDFTAVQRKLEDDLKAHPDFAIHLGQAPGATSLRLEAIGLNVGGTLTQAPEDYRSLVPDGPVAYRSRLPLADWARELRAAGVPAQVSYHAGQYLCNATLYLSHHIAQRRGLATQIAFVHVPLDLTQCVTDKQVWPSLPVQLGAAGLRIILNRLCEIKGPATA